MRFRTVAIVAVLAAAVWIGRARLARLWSRAEKLPEELVEHSAPGGHAATRAAPPTELSALRGETVIIRLLTSEPAMEFMAPLADDGADETNRAQLAQFTPTLRYDIHLARAAREFAAQAAALEAAVPDAAMGFLLHAAGAPEWTVGQYLLRTNSDGVALIGDAIRGAIEGRPIAIRETLRVGIGEASSADDSLSRYIVVLTAERDFEVETTSRVVSVGARWTVRFRTPSYRDLEATAIYPDGTMKDGVIEELGSARFTLSVAAGSAAGTVRVSVDGTGPEGPGKLMQLSFQVGGPPPATLQIAIPPAEDDIATSGDAEALAFQLLQQDRARFQKTVLVLDDELSTVARGHSEDMATHGFFAHRSPTTGLAGDRLEAAGYRANGYGENLALNDTIADADASLMASVGHRKNIMNDRFTRVGIGVAQRHSKLGSDWVLTQLFARPVPIIEPERAADQVIGAIAAARDAAGLEPLAVSDSLSEVAGEGAEQATDGSIDRLPKQLGRKASPLVKRAAMVVVQVLYELDDYRVPDPALDPDMRVVGVGVRQRRDSSSGRIGVVVIVGR